MTALGTPIALATLVTPIAAVVRPAAASTSTSTALGITSAAFTAAPTGFVAAPFAAHTLVSVAIITRLVPLTAVVAALLHHYCTNAAPTPATAAVSAGLTAPLLRHCRGRQTANTLESNRRCEKAETECEDTLEREQLVKLPSTGRFEDRFSHCQAAFDRACIGPAHSGQV